MNPWQNISFVDCFCFQNTFLLSLPSVSLSSYPPSPVLFFFFSPTMFGPKFCPHSFSTHQRFLTHSHLFILSSIQKKDREGIHQQKAVESYSAGGRRRVGDQTMLARSLGECALSVSLLLLHSLKLCISSVPPPLLFFLSLAFSVSRDVSLRSLNSPCNPLNPSSQSNGNNISNNRGPDQQNSFKSRKSSLALECWSEEGGTLTHAYRKLFIWPEIRHLLKSSLIS